MAALGNILVVLDDAADLAVVMEKAAALAREGGSTLHAVRVIYEGVADLSAAAIDDAARLKTFILEAAESQLAELLEPWPEVESVTLWNPRPWEGVIHAAEQVEADLIVKAASRHPRLGEIMRTPDDWNLLRHAQVPVMLVKPEAWVSEPNVLCALDVFDDAHRALNLAVLRQAQVLADQLGGALHIGCAYPLFEPWVGELGTIGNYAEIKASVEQEIVDRVDALAAAADVTFAQLHAEEGHTTHAMAQLAETLAAELLVIGTHAREGVSGVLLGNTSERLLHAVTTDVVTVPCPR